MAYQLTINETLHVLFHDMFSAGKSPSKLQPPNMEAIDLAAHLRLLGESLSTVGRRLKEHQVSNHGNKDNYISPVFLIKVFPRSEHSKGFISIVMITVEN